MLSKNLKISVIFASEAGRAEILRILDAIPTLSMISQSSDPESFFDSLETSPDLVLVELEDQVIFPEWLENLGKRLPLTAAILCCRHWQPDFMIQAVQRGFNEFLTIPFTQADLEAAVDRIWSTRCTKQSDQGHIITLTGYKGGVGVTTIAINLAMALAEQTDSKVVIVDLGRPFPDVAKFLNQVAPRSLTDIIGHEGKVDLAFIKKTLQSYEPKLDILYGCMDIEDQHKMEANAIVNVLNLLRHIYEYIIIDLGQIYDDVYANVIRQSDMVILLSGVTVTDLHNLLTIWPLLRNLTEDHVPIKVVVNRYNKSDSVQLKSLEKTIKAPAFALLPSDYHLLMEALVKGASLKIAAPRSNLWRKIENLAEKIVEELRTHTAEAEEKVPEKPRQDQHWLLPQAHRGTILAAFCLAVLALIITALSFFGLRHGGPSKPHAIEITKSVPKAVGPASQNPVTDAALPAPKTQAPKPEPATAVENPPEGESRAASDKLGAVAGPPTPAPEPSGSSSTEDKLSPKYVGSVTSNKYHYPECKWAKTILPEKLIGFNSVEEAQEKGYIRCPTCKPPAED
jgi:pilus assembly protein CpaE